MAATGCTTSGISFREDRRLEFTSPGYREAVTLPVTVSWTMVDFTPAGIDGSSTSDRGLFAVLVDRDPPPPGEGLDWFARDDVLCQRSATCPDAAWFRDRGIHATTDTQFVIERLPSDDDRGPEQHDVTIILLDGHGRRIGESAWTQPFEVAR